MTKHNTDRTTTELLHDLRTALQRVYGDRLAELVLFGSRARGDARQDSDVDVLVVLRDGGRLVPEVRRTSGVVAELSLQYGRVVSLVFTSSADRERAATPLLLNIRRDGIAL